MKKVIYGVVAAAVLAWLLPVIGQLANWNIWVWRKELINLTGLASFLLMTLVMLLAMRPRFIEKPLGGLDKMYHLHKWAGIWAVVLGLVHYGVKLAKGPMIEVFGAAVKEPRVKTFLEVFRDTAKDFGEWSVWIFAAMILLALWQRFPYHLWRYVHKALAIFYLVIVYHGLVLAPANWWLQPAGLLIGLAALIGSWCAVVSLTGRIGRAHKWEGVIQAVDKLNEDCFSLVCQVPEQWRHTAGQFAFLRLNNFEGAHPFTIASADTATGQVRFVIKSLGDYTQKLTQQVAVGQKVSIEGPYGCFAIPQEQQKAPYIWVAAGIGITPFVAWLESLQKQPDQAPQVQFYYCVKDDQEAVLVNYLQDLVSKLPSIELHINYSNQQGRLQAQQVFAQAQPTSQVWFCGPNAFAAALKRGAAQMGLAKLKFHQEIFKMR